MISLKEQLLLEQNDTPTLYVSRPRYFNVNYVINPWMTDHVRKVDNDLAREQWMGLVKALTTAGAIVKQADLQRSAGQPDTTFIANAGSYLPKNDGSGEYFFLISKFHFDERQGEEGLFEDYFTWEGENVYWQLPHLEQTPFQKDYSFEGDGDLLRAGDYILVGHGHRTTSNFVIHLWDYYGQGQEQIVPVHLVDPRFYHLDTCFFYHSVGDTTVAWFYPGAFSKTSRILIEDILNDVSADVYMLSEEEALQFAANAIGVGKTIIAHKFSDSLKEFITDANLNFIETPLGEFHKGGGSAKCLTLKAQTKFSNP